MRLISTFFSLFFFILLIGFSYLIKADEYIEPTINIYGSETFTIEEYSDRWGGNVIKVSHEGWPSYYLIDNQAMSGFQYHDMQFDPDLSIPTWVLFEW